MPDVSLCKFTYTNVCVCVHGWMDVCVHACVFHVCVRRVAYDGMSRYDIGIRLLPDINSITDTVVSAHRGVVK